MADPIIWPGDLLKPQSLSVDIAHRNLRSPAAANGFTQTVSNSAGVWRVSFSDIPVYTANMIKCWRAIDTLAEGMLNPISVPVWDYPRSPASTDDYGRNLYNFYRSTVPHSDGSPFDDDSEYVSSWTNIHAALPSTIGSVSISVSKSAPLVTLEPGQRFSVN